MTRASVVLLDLDGTLSDSAPGILASLRHAFAVNHIPPLDPQTERSLLGPPFYESLPPLLPDPDRLPAVIEAYRERYAAGIRLAVATSKPEYFAVPIVERLGLSRLFETVGGDDMDGSLPSKALVIVKVLTRLGRPAADTVLMVGDRRHDVLGAREHGIACIGAGWGYGLPGELDAAGAALVCERPADLLGPLGLDR